MKTRPSRSFEYEARRNGHFICGIDEVGRGCLAGPVVVAGVSLYTLPRSVNIQDSKLMTAADRRIAYDYIIAHSVWTVVVFDHWVIERLNIYRATQRAMYQVVRQLQVLAGRTLDAVLVDAMPLPDIPSAHSMTQGESRSISIAAASIVAKVTRDALMERYDKVFPGYTFGAHKGYATPQHYAQLDSQGDSIVHRPHFLRTWREHARAQGMVLDEQLSLFDMVDHEIDILSEKSVYGTSSPSV